MAHYALLNESGQVVDVVTGVDESIVQVDDAGNEVGGSGEAWEFFYSSRPWFDVLSARRTSYNTHGGQHANGGTPFRYNYAGIGYTFSDAPQWAAQGGAFIPPQPFPSWTLNPDTALWDAPVPMPTEGGPWSWDEETLSWVEVTA